MADLSSILKILKEQSQPEMLKGMSNFGINTDDALGIKITTLRKIARKIGYNTQLSMELWDSGIHEARILASMIADPNEITKQIIETWIKDFNSWDLCDQCFNNLFRKTSIAYRKAWDWTFRKHEFVKRAGFVLLACLAVHDKKVTDEQFISFFPRIISESIDHRAYVKKAVNWSLRQIGKRNRYLNQEATQVARKISTINKTSAHWIAKDALRELQNETFKRRMLE